MGPDSLLLVLDSAAILEAANLTAGHCRTTPEVVDEVQAGGATGRRLEQLLAAGLGVERADAGSVKAIERSAREAGNLARLSEADRSVLALAYQYRSRATLLSDDYTVLDIARRLGVRAQPVTKAGIGSTMDWQLRCAGCGRSFTTGKAGDACPVCGSEIRLKPKKA